MCSDCLKGGCSLSFVLLLIVTFWFDILHIMTEPVPLKHDTNTRLVKLSVGANTDIHEFYCISYRRYLYDFSIKYIRVLGISVSQMTRDMFHLS
jgi:hypothetical protein